MSERQPQVLLFDCETDGLLDTMTRHHCMVIRDAATRETYRFRKHDGGRMETRPLSDPGVFEELEPEDTIADGVRMLMDADIIVAHHGIGFDLRAIQLMYPWFEYEMEKVRDTLVLVRVICPDVEQTDYRLVKAGKLPGGLVGSHSLDAWGYRVGLNKGDYSKRMLARGLDPWKNWNWDQEEYCVGDIDVTEVIWASVKRDMPPPMCIDLEHNSESIGKMIEEDGYFFDAEGATALVEELEKKVAVLCESVIQKFGKWYTATKKVQVAPAFKDPKGEWKKKKYAEPNAEWGETRERAWWGGMIFPKKDMRSKKLGDRTAGCPYVPIKEVEFNPGSRDHISKMLIERYGWEPAADEWTKTGLPSVSEATLIRLSETVPVAKDLAEILFLNKLIGMIKTGQRSWLKAVRADERVHHYLNVGGTVSGRCSHNNPNLGQVPAILMMDVTIPQPQEDGSVVYVPNPKLKDKRGTWIRDDVYDLDDNGQYQYDENDDTLLKKEVPIFGRDGEYGWECRNLFYTPVTMMQPSRKNPKVMEEHEWCQVGVDLTGIEFRMLAHRAFPYDDGELVELAESGRDVHNFNREKISPYIEVKRSIIKRVFYGLCYGAGDWKLGYTADPTLSEQETTILGGQIRGALMKGVPQLKKVIDECKDSAKKGYLIGLDGRRLSCRSQHSSLNLRLQSDAALVAKRWLINCRDKLLAAGLDWGWHGDFVILAFVHDEIQFACKRVYADTVKRIALEAATEAGVYFDLKVRVDAAAKVGHSWADCH